MTAPLTRHIAALQRSTAPIGLGCMGMSWAYTTPERSDIERNISLIHAALDRGITLLDTSDAYAAGHNERLLGQALRHRTDDAIIATKGGLRPTTVDGKPALQRDATPAHLRAAIDASLTRLGVDCIDLYYLHRVDPNVPLEDSWGTLADAVRAGKIRALGLSEVAIDQAERAHAIHPVAAIQSELSLWTRDPLGSGTTSDGAAAGNVVAWCADHDAIFVPFSPLGRGFLTGALDIAQLPADDFRRVLPRFTGAALAHNEQLLATVREIADRHRSNAAAIALAWVLAQGPHVIPIPGTTKIPRLDENLAAASVQLTADVLRQLDELPAPLGSRY